MSKSNKNNKDRLKDSKVEYEKRAARHEVKQLIQQGKYDELDKIPDPKVEKEPMKGV